MKCPSVPLLLLASVLSAGAQPGPKFGDPAPAISVDLMDAPPGARTTPDALAGNAVVLEFWATWCLGCVQRIPHMNALAEKFQHRPVRFISISDEDRAIVERFLPTHPMSGWVAVDESGATFRRYGIQVRPAAALIDAKGVLRNVTGSGDAVSESAIESLLAGTLPVAAQPLGIAPMGSEPGAPLPVFQTLIRPAMRNPGMSPGAEVNAGGRWEGWGLTIRGMLSRTSDIPESRIIAPDWCDGERFDIAVPLASGPEERLALARQAIGAAFALKSRRETREIDVFVLRKAAGVEPKLTEDPFGMPLGRLIRSVEYTIKRPVFDETGLAGTYKFEIMRASDAQAFASAIREQLGLELAPSRRSLEVLVVEPSPER